MNAFNHSGDETTREAITPEEAAAAQLTAYALGQLQGEERAEAEQRLADDASQREVNEIKALTAPVRSARASEPLPQLFPALRERLKSTMASASAAPKVEKVTRSRVP